MENEWWLKKAHEIQAFADSNNTHALYQAVKSLYGRQRHAISPVKSNDGSTLYKDKTQILEHWARHFSGLLNQQNPSDLSIITKLPNLPPVQELDNPFTFPKVLAAVRGLKNNKSAGPEGIPAEFLIKGGSQ